MKKIFMLILSFFLLIASPVFAAKGGGKGPHPDPNPSAYEHANDNARFKRDADWKSKKEKKDKKKKHKKHNKGKENKDTKEDASKMDEQKAEE